MNTSVEHLAGVSYYLTRSHSLDIRASIHAFLIGNFQSAYDDIDEALNTYQHTNHRPGLSWSWQTKGLIQALEGRWSDARDSLQKAREFGFSPTQQLRELFIGLIADFVHQRESVEKGNLVALREQYKQQQLGWYPGILSLMIAALDHEPPQTQFSALDLFGEDIDASQMMKSYFYDLLF